MMWIILGILIAIHIVGWLIISGILYLFAQYPPSIGEVILIFFLWEIGIGVIIWESINEKVGQILSNCRGN